MVDMTQASPRGECGQQRNGQQDERRRARGYAVRVIPPRGPKTIDAAARKPTPPTAHRCAQLEAQLASTQGRRARPSKPSTRRCRPPQPRTPRGLSRRRPSKLWQSSRSSATSSSRWSRAGRIRRRPDRGGGPDRADGKPAAGHEHGQAGGSSVQLSAMASELASLELAMRHALSGDRRPSGPCDAQRRGGWHATVIAEALHKSKREERVWGRDAQGRVHQ